MGNYITHMNICFLKRIVFKVLKILEKNPIILKSLEEKKKT